MSTAPRLAALLLTGALVGCSGGSDALDPATTQATHDVSATSGPTRSGGSRAYMVATMAELSARADAIVVGTKSGPPREEPADEAGASGLTMTTTPFTVSRWIKGEGPESIPFSELNLTENRDEVAQIRPEQKYVLFLEKVEYVNEARYILVGGVGAYEIRDDGQLTRVDESDDSFPQFYNTLAGLVTDIRAAPATWTKTP